jgi:8-amino-3,8-dideoxy-alpha-D-manno-octulosonate transaminase
MPGSEFFGPEERKEVNDVLDTGVHFRFNHDEQRKGIWKSKEFEQELCKFNKVAYAHAVSSGSTAVITALASVGIGAGDEVIVPPFTYIATIEAVLSVGALPVFADIDDTLCLAPDAIEKAVTPRTKAVCLVQMCGATARMDEIVAVCEKHNLILVEDSAQAMGASYKGKFAGTIGKVGCYSFDFFKIITCGEGGAVVTNDKQVYLNADMYSDHGHDHIGSNRGMENHPVLGYNFRIGEMNSALGLAQIRKIDKMLSVQKANKRRLKETAAKFSQITFRHLPDGEAGDSATFLCFFMPSEATAKQLIEEMNKQGVNQITGIQYWWNNMYHYIKNWEHFRNLTSVAKLPIHAFGAPQDYNHLPIERSDDLMRRLVTLQIKLAWTDETLSELCRRFENSLKVVLG